VDIVAAEGADINVRCVGNPNRDRPVVGLQHPAAQVLIPQSEDTPLAGALLTPHLAGQGSIKDIDVELSPAVHLKDAARGASAEKRQIQLRSIEVVLDAVETPAYVGKTEVPDKAVSDTVALESGQRTILGRNLGAIDQLHAAYPSVRNVTTMAPDRADFHAAERLPRVLATADVTIGHNDGAIGVDDTSGEGRHLLINASANPPQD
jgi:hypothetical protein